jgi:hypothetical protein
MLPGRGALAVAPPNQGTVVAAVAGVGVWSQTAHPGLPLEVLLGRTVLLTVTQWCTRDGRRFSTGLGRFEMRNTLLHGVDLYVVGYKESL